jgi:polyphosphate kinase 2
MSKSDKRKDKPGKDKAAKAKPSTDKPAKDSAEAVTAGVVAAKGSGKGAAEKAAGRKVNAAGAPAGDIAAAVAGLADDKAKLPDSVKAAAFRSGDYPHDGQLDAELYEAELIELQRQLQTMIDGVRASGERLLVLFEGRDAAGKGGAIHRVTQHLNPRLVRVVALSKPTETEAGQWYFQRYVEHLPTRGEMVIFDRSWYNRAGVEPVMGFCTPEQCDRFLAEVPVFESTLVRDGIRLVKIFLTIGREMQLKRLYARRADSLKRWKLSPIDYESAGRWNGYSLAFDRMLAATDSIAAPWTVIKGNDKRRTRLEAIRRILAAVDYKGKSDKLVGKTDRKIVLTATEFLADGGED